MCACANDCLRLLFTFISRKVLKLGIIWDFSYLIFLIVLLTIWDSDLSQKNEWKPDDEAFWWPPLSLNIMGDRWLQPILVISLKEITWYLGLLLVLQKLLICIFFPQVMTYEGHNSFLLVSDYPLPTQKCVSMLLILIEFLKSLYNHSNTHFKLHFTPIFSSYILG